ncbi:MAG: XTP/dITP diphosphatase [Methanophagales archaeon]|nr:XTP/dITP diphosphatase [Methanophagales archaeon]
MKKIVFVTTNENKVKELRELAGTKINVEHLNYDYPELQLDETEAVARESANWVRERGVVKKPFFLEDSGLFVRALNGFPGPFSAFVAEKIGNEGILKLLAGKEGEERRATFKTVVAFCESPSPETAPLLFVGTAEGRIAEKPRGEGGFGYDPIFEFEEGAGTSRTFAEMSRAEKNAVSHRGRAFGKLLDYLVEVEPSSRTKNRT